MNMGYAQFRAWVCKLSSHRRMPGMSCVSHIWKTWRGMALRLFVLWSMHMTVHAEMPETIVTPQSNEVGGCVFDVRFDCATPTNLYWVIVFVSPSRGVMVPDAFYLEAWNKQGLLVAVGVGRSELRMIPDSLIRKDDKGCYFLLKLDRDVMENSWGAFRLNENRVCVIKLKDWCTSQGKESPHQAQGHE